MKDSGNKIGILEGISYCVGGIIGSGIFVSPTVIVKYSGSLGLSLIIWVTCALIAAIEALVYVELGTCIRKSGSDFAYLTTAGWKSVAAAFLFVSSLTDAMFLAIQTIAFGQYFVKGINEVFEKDLDTSNSILTKLIGFTALMPLGLINLFSLKKFVGKFQIIATVTKMTVILIIIGTGFWFLVIKGRTKNFENSFDGSTTIPDKIVLALYNGLFAYAGWNVLNSGTEEVDNPRRTLPIASFVGIGIAALVYLSMNVAYFTILTVEEFQKCNTVAATFAERTLGSFHYAIPFLISLLLMGSMNSTLFSSSRCLLAGARHKVLPTSLKSVHPESMSPRAAIVLEVSMVIMISFLGDLENLLKFATYTRGMQSILVQLSLLYMRHNDFPFPKDAYRNPIIVIFLSLGISLSLLVIPLRSNYQVGIYTLGCVTVGFIIYFVFIASKGLPKILYKIDEKLTILTTIFLNTLPISSEAISESPESESKTKGSSSSSSEITYDGKVLNVPISGDGAVDLINHWTDQAYSGLFAAVAARKFHEVSSEAQERLTKCSKESKDAYEHASCVSDLLKHREKYSSYNKDGRKPDFDKAFRKSASGFLNIDGIYSATTSVYEQSREELSKDQNLPLVAFQQEEEPENVQIQGSFVISSDPDSSESYSFSHRERRGVSIDPERKSIASRPNYGIKERNEGLSPLGAIAKVLLKSILINKNKKEGHSWQKVVQRIKLANNERKKLEEEGKIKKTKLPFDPESKIDALEKFAYRAVGEHGQFGNIDPENPENLKKLAKDDRLRNSSDPLRKFLNLLRNGIKLSYNVAGKNTTDFDDKILKVVSPRFLSVVPEEEENNIIDIISPSLFSLHSEGKGIENLTSLPNLVKSFNGADQQQWLDLIIEAAGVDEQAEKLEKELQEKKSGIKKSYQERVRGADGQPMFFTKENVTKMYGDHEKDKIETFEKLIKSYSMDQLKQMNETGFMMLTKDQLYLMYGPESPFNNSEVLEKLMKVHPDEAMDMIEKDIHLMGEIGNQRRKKRAIVLSPLINFPIVFAAPILS
ncbi:hypothetical protein FO519_009097, partial [Halicephalobus sp. NKZ332]